MQETSDYKISPDEYSLSYRNVKYPRLEFKTGNLVVVLPREYKKSNDLLEKHDNWIASKKVEIEQALRLAKKLKLNKKRSEEELKKLVNLVVKKDEKVLGVRIKIPFYRRMNSKWGSLSSKGNLTLNPILRYLPDEAIEYVIFHEIAHSISRKHDKIFWSVVSSHYPDHNVIERELFAYWFLMNRVKGQSETS